MNEFESEVLIAIDELSDELFLAFYKVGTIKPGKYGKAQLEIYLEAATRIQTKLTIDTPEPLYLSGINNVISDCKTAIDTMTCDMSMWGIGTIFFTGVADDKVGYFDISKWKITGISYTKYQYDSRVLYTVEALDTRECTHIEGYWTFTKDELFSIAWDNEDEIYEYSKEWSKTNKSSLSDLYNEFLI